MTRPITISVVDDQADLRESLIGYLNSVPGFQCVRAYANAQDAIIHLPKETPDVVLMDINLGGMDGIECVRILKPVLTNSQIVMLTVFEDTEKIFRALAAGASGYLLKRMPPAELLEAIHGVLNGGSPMSAPIARKVVQSFQAAPAKGDESIDLSQRELEVLNGLAEGLAYKEIADQLDISIHTVRSYVRRIYEKLHVKTRTQAVARFFRH